MQLFLWAEDSADELRAELAQAFPDSTPEPMPPLEGSTFDGYRNPDGSVGTRNILGISTSVNCVAGDVINYYDGNTVTAIQALQTELSGMATHPVTEAELRQAKDAILNRVIFNFDSKEKVLSERMLKARP